MFKDRSMLVQPWESVCVSLHVCVQVCRDQLCMCCWWNTNAFWWWLSKQSNFYKTEVVRLRFTGKKYLRYFFSIFSVLCTNERCYKSTLSLFLFYSFFKICLNIIFYSFFLVLSALVAVELFLQLWLLHHLYSGFWNGLWVIKGIFHVCFIPCLLTITVSLGKSDWLSCVWL